MDQEPHDPLPLLRAELDQAIAMAPEIARAARGIYDACIGEEFTTRQALHLTICQLLNLPGPAPE